MNCFNEIFIVFDKSAYFYSYEDKCIQLKTKNIIFRCLNKLLDKVLHFNSFLFIQNKELIKKVDKIVISDSAYSIQLHKYIMKINPSAQMFLYYMNTIDPSIENKMNQFDKAHIYTFDKHDSIEYNINYMHTPYSNMTPYSSDNEIYDVLFLGRSKGRDKELISIRNVLKSNHKKYKIMLLDSEDEEMKIDEYISYEQYLEDVSKSKCILEIIKKGQTGSTLRALEASWFQKKLITNNVNIQYDEYYDKENTYLMDTENINEQKLNNFLEKPYIKTNIDTSKIEFSCWISKFGEGI